MLHVTPSSMEIVMSIEPDSVQKLDWTGIKGEEARWITSYLIGLEHPAIQLIEHEYYWFLDPIECGVRVEIRGSQNLVNEAIEMINKGLDARQISLASLVGWRENAKDRAESREEARDVQSTVGEKEEYVDGVIDKDEEEGIVPESKDKKIIGELIKRLRETKEQNAKLVAAIKELRNAK